MNAKSPLPPEEYLGHNLLPICNWIETKIGHELNLINHRVSWLAASQTFLVIALATFLSSNNASSHAVVGWFLIAIPLIGLVLCSQVFLAVCAAFKVLDNHLLPERSQLTKELNQLTGRSFTLLGPDRLTVFFGAIPAKWIPVTFILMWLFFLILVIWRAIYP